MYLVREIMYCKPGKVRPMVDKFLKMSKLSERSGMPKMRTMTDFVGEQYWTIVVEMEVASLAEFEKMMSPEGMADMPPADMKEMEEIMKDYHDLVLRGRREVFRIEG
ncbi:MAG: hypothetical protein ABIS27_10795 [Longimicrobiales bacterium]